MGEAVKGPWEDFEASGDGPWADYAQSPQPLDPQAYVAELTRLVNDKAPRTEIEALVRNQGFDPSNPDQLKGLDEAIAAVAQGRRAVVQDMTPQAGGETLGQAFYRGVGDVAEGFGDVLGLVGNPLNAGINYVTGANLSTDLGGTFRDWTGAPDPVTDTERYVSAANQGGAAALTGAGIASTLARGGAGMTTYVAEQVAKSPALDTVAGVTSATGAEAGGDIGAAVDGERGRLIGSVAGGLAGGVSGLKVSERLGRYMGILPESVAFGANGRLTAEGHELAQRYGLDEEDIRQSYARVRDSGRRVPGNPEDIQARREAFRTRRDRPDVAPAVQPRAEIPQGRNLSAETDRILAEMQRRADDGTAFDGPAAPPPPPRSAFEEAREEGVQLTRGQAEQDFSIQNDENSLRMSSAREGQQARDWFNQQQQQIAGLLERFRSRFGEDPGTKADRGERLQETVRELRDQGQRGVSALYQAAEELGGEGLVLPTEGISNAITDVLIDELVPEGVKRAVTQEAARYGLIGEAAATNEAGITKVTLDDGSTVSFRGPVQELTASNAEQLRKAVNRLYMSDPSRASQGIKPAIDDALEEALTSGSEREGAIGEAYRRARAANRVQKQRFNGKDILEDLAASKKGADQTPKLSGEQAIARTIGAGPDGITNLRKVKGLLLSSGTQSARQAWGAMQHQGIAELFDDAISRNVNHGGGQIGDVISGAKLNSAIERFGIDKLRILLSPEDFNGLMKIRRIVGNATIPITGTTNPSGTATKILNFLRGSVLRISAAVPGLSTVVDSSGNLLAKARDKAVTRRTLEGITSYTGPDSARRMDQAARDFVAEYIRSGKSGELVPTSINLSATQGGRPE